MEPSDCFRVQKTGVVQIFLEKNHQKIGNGSGFLVNNGIVTNSHVIRAANFDAIAIRFDESNPNDQGSYIRVVINDVVAAESQENERDYAFLQMAEPEFDGIWDLGSGHAKCLKSWGKSSKNSRFLVLNIPFWLQNNSSKDFFKKLY